MWAIEHGASDSPRPSNEGYKAGTPDLYPFQNSVGDKCLSHLTIRPRFVGLAARPRAATLPRTADGKAGGSFAVQPGCGVHTPAGLAWSPVCAPRPGGRGARLAVRGRPAEPDDAHPQKIGFPRR